MSATLKTFILLLAAGGLVWAAGGCTVQVAQRERPLVQITPLEKELEVLLERRTDEVKTAGLSRDSESNVSQGIMRLSTTGDVYHPNLMTFAAGLGWGFFRQDYTFNDDSDHKTGQLDEYSLQMNFLRQKAYPSTFYFHQNDSLVARQFLGPLRVQSSTWGWVTYLRWEDWPMNISWTESVMEQDSEVQRGTDYFRRDSARLGYSVAHDFSDRSSLGFRFDWDQTAQSSVSTQTNIDKKNYNLDHKYKFGDEQQHSFHTYASFLDQSGIFEAETVDWNERLILNHAENFQTFYEFKYNDYQYETTASDRIRGNVGFRHLLYESLVTDFNLFTSRDRFSNENNADTQGGSLLFSYRKTNPWGELIGSYSITPTWEKSEGRTEAGLILNEAHFYDINNPASVILEKRNIDTSTIQVTDGAGLMVYQRNDDYSVSVTDGLVHLTIIPFSPNFPSINDSQTLLVTYRYLTDSRRGENSLMQTFRLRQNFTNNFSLYYEHYRRDEDIEAFSTTAITPNEYQTNTFGAGYNYEQILLSAEHSRTDSTQTSSASTSVRGNYSFRLTRDTSLAAHASQSWYDFSGTRSRYARLFTAGGSLASQISDQLNLFVGVDWRDENDSDIGDTRGLRFTSELNYKFRLLTVTTGLEYYSLDRLSTENTSSNIYVKLVRRF